MYSLCSRSRPLERRVKGMDTGSEPLVRHALLRGACEGDGRVVDAPKPDDLIQAGDGVSIVSKLGRVGLSALAD